MPTNHRESSESVDVFRQYRDTPSQAIRNDLVTLHEHVAERCARRYQGRGEDLSDLRQVAMLGLIKAVERFDPDLGVDFERFAYPTITGEIKRHFRDTTWRVSVPRRVKDLRTPVFTASEALHSELERPPTAAEIANRIGVEESVVVDTLAANQQYRASAAEDSERDAAQLRHTAGTDATDATLDGVRVLGALQSLGDRERQIMYWRYYQDCTQTEIGERLGIGQVQVSRLIRRSLEHLRTEVASDFAA